MSKWVSLSDTIQFIDKRIETIKLTLENYISTENMKPDRGGVVKAKNLPPINTSIYYKEGDILISNIRLYFKKIWLSDRKGGASADVLVLRVKEGYSSKFMFYVLSDSNFFNYADVTSKGTKMPRGDKKAIKKYLVPKFDLKTQERIANILSTYDKLIENNNRRIEILEKTAEEIYKEWFVRMRFPGYKEAIFKKGIPIGWEVKKVGDVINRLNAGHFYKEDELLEDGEVIVIDQSTKEYLGFHNGLPTHISDIENPIILFGDHSCKMIVMTKPFSLGENIVPFISKNNQLVLFLFYSLKRLMKTEEYKRHWKELINKKIYYPNIKLQKLFGNTVKDSIAIIGKYKKQNQNLIKQRDLLLPRLMNGTIEVK